ncbi:hypothetical protein FRC19_007736 [Serendipita sp. 401]|nr:hypothetical protein FRC19_007736 [Serendipita sp. 401]
MDSSPQGSRMGQLGRTAIKLTARMILASIILHALLSYGNTSQNRVQSPNLSSPASIYKPDTTHWSTPSAPQGTITPDHVQDAEHPASPVPEDVVIPDSDDTIIDAMETGTGESEGFKVTELASDKQEEIEEFIRRLLQEDKGNTEERNVVQDEWVDSEEREVSLEEGEHRSSSARTKKTEEELAMEKRLKDIETKEKRANIEGRHTRWEEKLEKAGAEELAELIQKARKIRQDVVQTMRTTPEMFDLLKKMQQDGTKHVYNTDKYLLKLKKEGVKDDAVKSKWEEIVRKVQKKLDEQTIETTTYLKNWYESVMRKEKPMYQEAAQRMNQLAGEAQDDLGMDYAWLDDVSVDDWTRYHGLKDAAKKWTDEFETVFNSTHIEMLQDPVPTELLQVETAMIRVAADLNKLLDEAKERGDKWLTGGPETISVPATPSASSAASVETEPPAPSPLDEDDHLAISVEATRTHTTPLHKEL